MSELKRKYEEEIVPKLAKELGLKNFWSLPRLKKVVINMGLGEGAQDKKLFETVFQELALITGQKPKITRARKAIAGFKLRQGDPIGAMITLRGERMYDFLEKLFRIALPRVRDFQGLSREGFDGQGNYNLGLKEQIVFPEIDYGKIVKVRGLEITIVTSTTDKKEAEMLLSLMGMPFEKPKEPSLKS